MATKASMEQRLPLIAVMVMAALMAFSVEAQVPTVPPGPPTTTTPTVAQPPLTTTTTAVPPPASTSVGCTNAITALLPCANYVTGTNGTATPACCNAFVAVIVNNAATCLCQFLSTQNPLGFSVNQTRALALPAACNVTTPSLATQCAAIGVPLTPTSGLPLTPTSPGSSPVPIASAPTALPSPGPSATGETPGTAAVPPKVGNPSGSGLPVSTASGGSSPNVGNSRPSSNGGVSISAAFPQWSRSIIMGVILGTAFM